MTQAQFTPTPEQQRIINHGRSAFISACPGAGKTRILVERARVLLKERNTGRGIAFLSFTNAAISELAGRLQQESLLPSPPFPHFVGTFDSFIWQFLIAPLGIPGSVVQPRLIPDKDQRLIAPYPNGQTLPLSCFDRITGAIIPEQAVMHGFDAAENPTRTKQYVTSAQRSRERFLARGELDFDDLRLIVKGRLADVELSKRLATALAARFRELIVDEAQDCNPDDLEIIDWLRKASIVTIVICDPHQSIYGFRGGVTEQLFEFGKTFDEEDRLPMNGNFRSTDNICKAIVTLRAVGARGTIDQALGDHRTDPTYLHILSYPGVSVPAKIGAKFHELVEGLNYDVTQCPVLAATRQSAATAIGQPVDKESRDITLRLASAVTDFYFASEAGDRKLAMEEVHQIVLELAGRMGKKTYHQFLAAEGIEPDKWRPQVLQIIRALQYDPTGYANADAWHARAKELLAPYLPVGGASISQRMRRNSKLGTALAAAPLSSPSARTIHSVKGMQFPAVCVVMTPPTTKGILEYLEKGEPKEHAEGARKIYVAASRAQRLLAIAVPKSQASRLVAHIGNTGARVTLIAL